MGPHTVLPAPLATVARCSFCSGSRSRITNFAMTSFMPRSCVKISDTVVFGICKSASSSHTVNDPPLLIAACTHSTFSGVQLVEGFLECGSLSTDSQASLKHFGTLLSALHSLHRPKSLLNHPNSFCRGMFKLNAKFDADSFLYSLSHFECDGHTVHMLIQRCLLPPLSGTVKSSLFTHAHSSPLSLAARLHRCCANDSHYSNNGWTFSRWTSYSFWQAR